MARFSLYGLYQYDPTLFDNIELPEELDKQFLVAEIFSNSGDLFPYYQVPAMFKMNVEFWFKRNYFNFKKSIQALMSEFNPVENYDRYEDMTETPDITRKRENSGSDSVSVQNDGSVNTTTMATDNGSNERQTSAYNANTYEPADKNIISDSSSGSNDTITSNTATQTTSYGAEYEETESGSRSMTSHIHGNIGVTRADEMIASTIRLYETDLYKNIARRFEKEFLVQVY